MQANEQEIHLLEYWDVLRKRRSIGLLFFVMVVGLTAVYTFTATPIYRGTAKILLNLEKNPVMTFAEGGAAYLQVTDASEYYRTQMEILNSRAFGDRVVKKLQLDKNVYFVERKDRGTGGLFAKLRSYLPKALTDRANRENPIPLSQIQDETDPYLTSEILQSTEVEIGKGSNILKISYYSDNPLVAAAMANGVANAYIEHNLDIRVRPFRDAVEWLSARMVESRARVEESEKVVQRYKEKKGIVSFEGKENVITQKLQELVTQLVHSESKRQETEARYRQIASVIESPELLATVPDIMNNFVIQQLRSDELNIKKKLSELGEKYGEKHPQMIRARTELETVHRNLLAEARKMLNAAKTDYDIARARETSLRRTIDEQKLEVLDLGSKNIEYGVIAGEAVSNKQFYELLLKKLQEASLSSGINVSNAQLIDGATIPSAAIKPARLYNMTIAVFIGLLGGIIAAIFVEYMDDTVKTPEDIEKLLGLPFFGYVPTTDSEEGPLYMFSGKRAAIAEAYRTIRTSVMLSSTEDNPFKVVLVTSTTPHEGKTTTAANMAIAMAQMGERVLLIDTDMRRHNMHKVFSLENLVGISDMIVDHNNTDMAIRTIPDIPNLHVITGGTLAPNPSELLGSNSMRQLIRNLRGRFDRIILDSPPLMVFADSLVLARLADGVLFVIWGGMTGKDNIRKSVQGISGVGGKVLGVILNNIDLSKKTSYYYYPYYNHYYGEKEAGKKTQ